MSVAPEIKSNSRGVKIASNPIPRLTVTSLLLSIRWRWPISNRKTITLKLQLDKNTSQSHTAQPKSLEITLWDR
jgi:hypothetical protein